MTTYRKIHGRSIQAVTTDPTESVAEGQVWYNTTSDTFKSVVALEAWASSAGLPGNRTYNGGAGSQTAALSFGGAENPPGTGQTGTFEYNGSGWASGGALPATLDLSGGMGTQTAALSAFGRLGGSATAEAFEYDGASWTASGDGGTTRWGVGSAGTQTAGLAFGGFKPGPNLYNNTEEYNGSSWSEVNNLSTARNQVGFLGDVQTSALCIGGEAPSVVNTVEGWNGTSWSSETNYPATSQGSAGVGIESAGLVFAPSPNSTNAFKYDGTTFTAAPSLGNGRQNGSRAGTTSAALAFGGNNGSGGNFTEEFNKSANVITAAAWAAGGNLPGPISSTQGGGTQTAGIQMSGQPNAPGTAATTAVNEYDGSSWTSGGALPAGAASYGGQASKNGTQTAMLYWKGHYSGNKNTVSSYDGSSWTAQSTFPNTDVYGGGCGTLTAALSAGGAGPSSPYAQVTTFESDGSYNWTAGGNMGNARYLNGTVGLQTNAVTAGGVDPPAAPVRAQTEEYDGSSWTAKSDMISGKSGSTKDQCFGTNSDDMMVAGGPPNTTSCIQWNGTTWSTRPSISTGRHGGAGAGASSTSGWIAGGQSPFKNATEEFTGETTALNVKTLTQS